MSERLRVDGDRLADLVAQLRSVRDELDAQHDVVDAARGAIGARDVRAALDTFAGNWRRSRGRVLERIDSVAELAAQGASVFAEADAAQAAGFGLCG